MKSPAQPDPWLGRSVGDRQRYRLEQRLGAGGMGDVFLAMDTLLGQHVALKLLKDKLVGSPALRKRFEREVAICAALKSDHIVNVSDYGVTAEGYPFYVMEYLRGQTLKQLLQQQRRLDVKRAVRIITQVCEGLRLAHAGVTLRWNGATAGEHVKVVHRDLKPDNIFLVPTALGELVKILDFGIAKIRDESVDQTSITRGFIGTLRYAAPEQLRVEKNLDERADIYSLGVILYEMLSGVAPYSFGNKAQGGAGMSWAVAQRSQSPVSLRAQSGCGYLPPALEAVVMRCLQKEPRDRFASVEDLNQALQVAMSGEGAVDGNVSRSLDSHQLGVADDIPPQQDWENTPINKRSDRPKAGIPNPALAQTSPPIGHKEETLISPQQAVLRERAAKASGEQILTPSESTHSLPTHTLFLLGAGIGFSLTVLGTFFVYNQLQPGENQILNEIKALQTAERYESCIYQAEKVALDSNLYQDAQSLLHKCQLEYAKQLAAKNDFAEAIAIANQIPKTSSLYSQAQALIGEWSEI